MRATVAPGLDSTTGGPDQTVVFGRAQLGQAGSKEMSPTRRSHSACVSVPLTTVQTCVVQAAALRSQRASVPNWSQTYTRLRAGSTAIQEAEAP